MLSNADLSAELEALAKRAGELAAHVRGDGDLPARTLAGALVEADKIGDRLTKLGKALGGQGDNGRKRK